MTSLSAVAAITSGFDPQSLRALSDAIEDLATEGELVLVAFGLDDEETLDVKALVQELPDCTCLFLGQSVDRRTALLAGVDNAVCDYIFLCEGRPSDPDALSALVVSARDGADISTAWDPQHRDGLALYHLGRRAYLWIFNRISWVTPGRPGDHAQLLTRATALFIMARPAAETLMGARGVGSGFAARVVEIEAREGSLRNTALVGGFIRALASVLAVSAAPLRLASLMALGGGAFSVLYSVYVVCIYLFSPHVQAGWATLSLQISMMMFFFSIILFLLSEYIIQIYRANSTRARRLLPLRELRSPLSRRSNRLNVIDAEGRFKFGAPEGTTVA